MAGTLASRNLKINSIPAGVHQPTGSLSGGQFSMNNLPIAHSKVFYDAHNMNLV